MNGRLPHPTGSGASLSTRDAHPQALTCTAEAGQHDRRRRPSSPFYGSTVQFHHDAILIGRILPVDGRMRIIQNIHALMEVVRCSANPYHCSLDDL